MLNNSDLLSLKLNFFATISQKLKLFINSSHYHKFYIICFFERPRHLTHKVLSKRGGEGGSGGGDGGCKGTYSEGMLLSRGCHLLMFSFSEWKL